MRICKSALYLDSHSLGALVMTAVVMTDQPFFEVARRHLVYVRVPLPSQQIVSSPKR